MVVTVSEQIGSPDEMFRRLGDKLMNTLRVAIPGIIQSFDPVTQTVVVQPALRERVKDQDGNLQWVQLPVLPDVPVVLPRAGGFVLIMPVQAGDECLVIFADSCIDAWWSNGGIQNQIEVRRHDLSDAFAIMGGWSQPNRIQNYDMGAAGIIEVSTGAGMKVSSGALQLSGATINWNGSPVSIGQPGEQGPIGNTGAIGPIGNTGLDGANSIVPGPQGIQGITGLNGAQGIQGVMGPSAGVASYVINQVPTGTVNGINRVFTTAQAFLAGSTEVYRDGQCMAPTGDYVETNSTTITFVIAPVTGSTILIGYLLSVPATGNADTLDGYHAGGGPNQVPVLDGSSKLPYTMIDGVPDLSVYAPKANPTFTGTISLPNGSIPTAALAAHAVTQQQTVLASFNQPTWASSTPDNIPDMTVTMITIGGDLYAIIDGSFSNSGAGAGMILALSLDGATPVGNKHGASANAGTIFHNSTQYRFANVAAGSHTVRGTWAAWAGGTVTNIAWERTMTVVEYKN